MTKVSLRGLAQRKLRAFVTMLAVLLGVAFIVLTRYNDPDPATLPFLAALAREGRRLAAFSPYKPGTTEAEQARIDPFLHNTDTSIDEALERPGPTLEIWELNGPGS